MGLGVYAFSHDARQKLYIVSWLRCKGTTSDSPKQFRWQALTIRLQSIDNLLKTTIMNDITININGGNNQILPNATEARQYFYGIQHAEEVPSPHSWHIHRNLCLIDWHFWLKSSLYYLLHNIQQHVILNTYYLILNFYGFIDWNLWPFPARSANSIMNIYGIIYDYFWPPKSAKRKTFMAHWWSFLTKKVTNHPNPSKIPFWSIQAIHDLTFNL